MAGSGLFECVQIFVISNGTFTKYYSNTTRVAHIKEKNYGSIRAGGYIWYTTGSAKTLASFNVVRLASQFPFINKIIL